MSAETEVGKAAYVCDYDSGKEVYAREARLHLPIASMCKIMTLLLSFEAADAGLLSYEEPITVSEHAAGMGGSQVFLDAGLCYPAGELIKTVAVCSANDSCVALAERLAGSEEAFVAKMNARARELGAEDTLFANCTGLPKEPQYSCARDVALMLRALLGHPAYYPYAAVWCEDFAHPDGRTTSITNTNKLTRRYTGCDGGKTGFTSEAGFCLAATAKRGETRIVSVVIGADSSEGRFDYTAELFDRAFAAYETKVVLGAGEVEATADVSGSRKKQIALFAEMPLKLFVKKGEVPAYEVVFETKKLRAPVSKGTEGGEAVLYEEGVEAARVPLLAGEEAPRLTYLEALHETARNWQ